MKDYKMTDSTIDTKAIKEIFIRRANTEAIKKVNSDMRNPLILIPLIRGKYIHLDVPHAPPAHQENPKYSFFGQVLKPDAADDKEYEAAYKEFVENIKWKWAYIVYKEKLATAEKNHKLPEAVEKKFEQWCDFTKYGLTWDADTSPKAEKTNTDGEVVNYDKGTRIVKASNAPANGQNVVYDERRTVLDRGTPEWDLRVKSGNFFTIGIKLYYATKAQEVTGGLGAVQFVQYGPPMGGGGDNSSAGGDAFKDLPTEDPLAVMGELPEEVAKKDEGGWESSTPKSNDLDDEIPF